MVKNHKAKTVLVIEDEASIRDFACQVLELEGYCVLPAEDGETGLKLAKENQISLALLDLRLPGLDGWKVLVQIISTAELLAIPVVVFSAQATVRQRDEALNMGAADYLVKPVSAAHLRDTVSRVLLTSE